MKNYEPIRGWKLIAAWVAAIVIGWIVALSMFNMLYEIGKWFVKWF